jgi:hypothetical protein
MKQAAGQNQDGLAQYRLRKKCCLCAPKFPGFRCQSPSSGPYFTTSLLWCHTPHQVPILHVPPIARPDNQHLWGIQNGIYIFFWDCPRVLVTVRAPQTDSQPAAGLQCLYFTIVFSEFNDTLYSSQQSIVLPLSKHSDIYFVVSMFN